MALVIKDRVKETTTTTGTGTLTLAGAANGFQSFAAIGDANTTYYAITDSATGDWEVGLGTYTASGTALSRDTILASSNSGSAVSLAAGSKNVFATYPAGKAAFFDDIPTNNNQLTNGAGYITGNQTITLSGDASGSGTTSIAVTVADDSHSHSTSTLTGLGALATLSSVNAATITDNSVGAAELNVTGNGTTAQYLRSDGDGTFTWETPPDTNTTYSAGAGLDLTGTTFSVESDLRGDVFYIGRDTNDYIGVETTQINFVLDGNTDARLYNNGDFHADGNVIAYSTSISDARLKKDVSVVENALEKVNKLRGVEFTYTYENKRSAGVIAQELEAVLPQAVSETHLELKTGSKDDQYKVVQYDQIHALLIEAIKELTDRVEELEAQAG